jgi:hypothetical protein
MGMGYSWWVEARCQGTTQLVLRRVSKVTSKSNTTVLLFSIHVDISKAVALMSSKKKKKSK